MTEHTNHELKALAPIVSQMPHPQDLRAAVRRALEEGYQAARVAQGAVTMPADTFALQRALAGVLETFKDYAAAFSDAAKRVAAMQVEQLTEAVGEQAGIPNQGLTIPDPDGDVSLSLETPKSYSFDLDQLVAVVAQREAQSHDDDPEYAARVVGVLLGLGKFEPQVTKVKAYAGSVARGTDTEYWGGRGNDQLSAVVSSAIRSTSEYKGVKFTRKAAK